jgi:hypothetical protein
MYPHPSRMRRYDNRSVVESRVVPYLNKEGTSGGMAKVPGGIFYALALNWYGISHPEFVL